VEGIGLIDQVGSGCRAAAAPRAAPLFKSAAPVGEHCQRKAGGGQWVAGCGGEQLCVSSSARVTIEARLEGWADGDGGV
jgi:hypothetical protein